MSEFGHFLHAVRFLTVVPVPAAAGHLEPDWLSRCAKYFPLVGAGVGLVSAAVFLLAHQLWSGALPALLAVMAAIMLTGAFHEDGLADTIDGLGGGWSREARLTIMKDSRIGTYGALALGFSVVLRVAALASLPAYLGAVALVAAQGGSRIVPIAVMRRLRYAGDPAAGKVLHSNEGPRAAEFAVAIGFALVALLPLAWTAPLAAAAAAAGGVVLAAWFAAFAHNLLGGYTGDVLGGIEQLFEIGFMVCIAAMVSVWM
ncbi:MAG: adenosylcobinamide-GDP ribazoletransferase [Xanthobacteraceae bacterium]|nr:MAG: adenosylcobinamide-GDP ribazoletransferase [Xanthobacteraceae bacterium]